MGIHDGHRGRLREQFNQHGLDSFNDITALELLLFYSVPRKDTNEIAHRLLGHFGSLHDVFNASLEELMEVPGISFNSAVLISLLPQLMKKVEMSKVSGMKTINSVSDAAEYFIPRFMNERDELLLILCLDSKNNIICCREIARGTVNSVDANSRRIVEMALKHKAVSVILAHNHPRGVAVPSREDDHTTQYIYKALRLVGINLDDHLIIADDNYFSLANAGLINRMRY